MAGSLDSNSHVQAFLRFLQTPTARVPGINGSGLAYFAPESEIRKYFATHGESFRRIIAAAGGEEERIHFDDVQERYTIILAILLSIGYVRHLKNFVDYDELRDERLPFYTKPYNFPVTTDSPDEFWDKFYEEQWKFCPRPFEVRNEARIDPKQILPILEKQQIGQYNPPCKIQKVVLHADYDKLRVNSNGNQNHTYVFKEFHGRHAQKAWSQEHTAFEYVANGQDQWPIVKFYGSFSHGGVYTIILEYANKDTLDHFITTTDMPTSVHDVYRLWDRQLGLIDALYRIHNIPTSSLPYPVESKEASILRGFHQDIKPHNILVFGKSPESEYDVDFRLSDLGLSHFHRLCEDGQDVAPITSRGTKQFGAPELFAFDHAVGQISIGARPRVDIWSLGCVLSEFAVWLILGPSAVAQYRAEREAITIVKRSDIGCFHDSIDVLDCVEKWHDKVIEHKNYDDHITSNVLHLMVNEMLFSQPEVRPTANQLLAKRTQILGRAKRLSRQASSATEATDTTPGSATLYPHIDKHNPIALDTNMPITTTTAASEVLDGYLVAEPEQSDGDSAQELSPYSDHGGNQSSTKRADSLIKELEALSTGTDDTERSIGPGGGHELSPLSPAPLSVRKLDRNKLHTDIVPEAENMNHARPQWLQNYRDSDLPEPVVAPKAEEQQAAQPRVRPRASTTSKPCWTLRDGLAWQTMRKAGTTRQGMPDNDYLKRLRGRDFIFIVDDAATMAPHWNEVKNVVKLLGWLLKDNDDDGIELCFTGEPSAPYRAPKQRSSTLQDRLRQRKAKELRSTTDITWRLSNILKGYVVKLERHKNMKPGIFRSIVPRRNDDSNVKPLMLYVLTDGIWEDGSDPSFVITEAAERLQQLDKPSDQVGIQFIRFGDDQESVKKLQRLDSGLDALRDIVDTEPVSGNVFKMLLGPLFRLWDDD